VTSPNAAESAGGAYSAIGSTGQVGEAALKELGGESQVYFNSNLGGRYVDQLVDGVANESKVGYQTLTSTNQLQIMKDVDLIQSSQINGSTWHFFTSPVTGAGGPSAPLANFLTQNGIKIVVH
jgi:filamentous hemagglutinin